MPFPYNYADYQFIISQDADDFEFILKRSNKSFIGELIWDRCVRGSNSASALRRRITIVIHPLRSCKSNFPDIPIRCLRIHHDYLSSDNIITEMQHVFHFCLTAELPCLGYCTKSNTLAQLLL